MEKTFKCCICGNSYYGYGNNPYPLCDKDDYDSRCCDDCDAIYVIPARMYSMSNKTIRDLISKDYKTFIDAIKEEK